MSLFGTTANKPAFGATGATSGASPFSFGNTSVPPPTSSTSLFGSTTTSATKPLFGSSGATTTTSGPLFGSGTTTGVSTGFGQTSTGGSLFGSKPPTTGTGTGGGLFGASSGFGAAKPGGLFGTTQQQQQQQAAATGTGTGVPTLQDVIQNCDNLIRSLTSPDLFGDGRDTLVARLNQMLAACGVGYGYVRSDQQPVPYNSDGPFHRFKAIGYNRRSEYEESDGIVSIMMCVSSEQLASSTQRQKLIDALNVILGNNTNVRAHLEAIRPMPSDPATEVLIYVTEKGKGRVSSKELSSYLKQPNQSAQLKAQLCVSDVVPRYSMDTAKLRVFLETPPAGFDTELWKQAVRDNPDPERLVPYPIRGFEQLRKRQDLQNAEVRLAERAADELRRRLVDIRNDIIKCSTQGSIYKQRQKQLSHRFLRCLILEALIERYSIAVDGGEERLESRLEALDAALDAPNQIKSRVHAIINVLRNKSEDLKACGGDGIALDEEQIAQIRKYLQRSQQALESIVTVVQANRDDLRIVSSTLQ